MAVHLLIFLCSTAIALVLWGDVVLRPGAFAFGLLSLWQLYCALSIHQRPRRQVVLRLGGFSWDIFSFCRGWLITGQVGSGKTVAAINTML